MIDVSVKSLKPNQSPRYISAKPIVVIGALFFIFGFVTWLNSVLIPYLKIACELNNFKSYLVAFSFYISYMLMAVPSAWVLKITGYKKGISLGLFIMAIGAIVFVPAALSRTYGLFLLGLFIQGTGLALLQTAANPYVVLLGPRESAAKRISMMGICNVVAGVIATLMLGAIVLSDVDGLKARLKTMTIVNKISELDMLATKVITPYIIMSLLLAATALLIYFSNLPEVDPDEDEEMTGEDAKTSIFQFPHLLLGVLTLFLYVGVEVLSGDSIISYAVSQGIPLSTAKFFTSCTLSGLLIGFFLGSICIPKLFSQEIALKGSAVLGVIFSLCAIFTKGYVSVAFIALLGLANSMMWPSIWPLAIADLGKFTKVGSSLLIMAIGGGALIPLLYGRLSDMFTPRHAYWIMVPCYLCVLYFAVWGHAIRTKRKVKNVITNTPVNI